MSVSQLLSLNIPVAIAHRGGSKLRPENTMAAFDHAVSLGVDALECDVHLSRDGDAVVIHDPTLDRTTDATGPVAALTADELARVDAGHHFGPELGHPHRGVGIGVPRLSALLDRHRDLPIIIEMKGADPTLAARTIEIVRTAGAAERIILGGFDDGVLDAARGLAPDIVTSASRGQVSAAFERAAASLALDRDAFQLFQVPFRFQGRQMFEEGFVHAARRADLPVHAWIIDEIDDMRRLIAWGVTGLISDRPDVAVEVVKAVR